MLVLLRRRREKYFRSSARRVIPFSRPHASPLTVLCEARFSPPRVYILGSKFLDSASKRALRDNAPNCMLICPENESTGRRAPAPRQDLVCVAQPSPVLRHVSESQLCGGAVSCSRLRHSHLANRHSHSDSNSEPRGFSVRALRAILYGHPETELLVFSDSRRRCRNGPIDR
jgi:hypothetical protein